MKIILPIIAALVLTSCVPVFEYSASVPESVTDLESAFAFTSSLKAVPDPQAHGIVEYWQAPEETLDRGTGDCEDFAILFSYLAQELGHDADVIIVVYSGGAGHALSVVDGVVYDPSPILGQCSAPFTPDTSVYQIDTRFTCDEAIYRAINKYGSY